MQPIPTVDILNRMSTWKRPGLRAMITVKRRMKLKMAMRAMTKERGRRLCG